MYVYDPVYDRMKSIVCRRCGKPAQRHVRAHSGMCMSCKVAHHSECLVAVRRVHSAIRRGALPKAVDCACVDCGGTARDYDHRDYTKPLDVVPVCRPCNLRRGVAFDSVFRPLLDVAARNPEATPTLASA